MLYFFKSYTPMLEINMTMYNTATKPVHVNIEMVYGYVFMAHDHVPKWK